MTRGFSLWLDILRSLAALTVLFGHMAHIRFTRGDYYFLREINIASDAVAVFFVLSGVVIAYAAGRDGSLGKFAFNRATRLFTVIVPAIFLTLLFDGIGTRIDMAAYPRSYYYEMSVPEFLFRGLTLSPEWNGLMDRVRLGTNGPLWSLSYEAVYYAMFAVLIFLKGALRIVLLALFALIAGLPILLLLPAWAIGALLWTHIAGRDDKAMPVPMAVALAAAPIGILVALRIAGVPDMLLQMTSQALGVSEAKSVLYFSDEVFWNLIIALCVAAHLLGVSQLSSRMKIRETGSLAKSVRWFAGASFSVYVMHYPTLHLLDATLPVTLPGYDLVLLGLTLAVCFGFAALFERPLSRYRSALSQTANRLRPASAQ